MFAFVWVYGYVTYVAARQWHNLSTGCSTFDASSSQSRGFSRITETYPKLLSVAFFILVPTVLGFFHFCLISCFHLMKICQIKSKRCDHNCPA